MTAYTADGTRELDLPPADQYTAMIDHVLAVLHGQVTHQITPASTLDALELTLELDRKVAGRCG